MNLFKRTFISISRTPLKVCLLLFLVITTGSLVIGATLINDAAESTIGNLEQRLAPVMTIKENIEPLIEQGYSMEEIMSGQLAHYFEHLTSNQVREIGALPYVRYFDYSIIAAAWSEVLNPYLPEATFNTSNLLSEGRHQIRLDGVSTIEPFQFSNGLFSLKEGRFFTNNEMIPQELPERAPVLISMGVANLNDLVVGSFFNLYDNQFQLVEGADIPEGGFVILDFMELYDHPYNTDEIIIYPFEVIGIFDIEQIPAVNAEDFYLQMALYNAFITPNWRTEQIARDVMESELAFISVFDLSNLGFDALSFWEEVEVKPYWLLNSWEDVEAFKLAAEAMLPDLWLIEDLTSTLSRVTLAMNMLNGLSNQVLWFTIGAMIIVLSLLIILYLQDRRHEIAIYLSLGEKKFKILLQLFFEVGLVAMSGLTIAMTIGSLIAPQISTEMLRNELVQSQTTQTVFPSTLEFGGFGRIPTTEETMEAFTITLSLQIVAIFYGIGLGVMAISTIVPVVYVLELNPKDILMKANIE